MSTEEIGIRSDRERSTRIEQLRERLAEIPGGYLECGNPNIDPGLEEEFLKNVLSYEEAQPRTILDWLSESGLRVSPPGKVGDQELNSKLWELIRGLSLIGVFLHSTDHLDDRELYMELWEEILQQPVVLTPENPRSSFHIDLVGGGSDEDIDTYLRFFASEAERRSWAEDWPEDELPPAQTTPYDRDRLLPKWRYDQPGSESQTPV